MDATFIYGNGNHSLKKKIKFPLDLRPKFEELAGFWSLCSVGINCESNAEKARRIEEELGITYSYRSIAVTDNSIIVYR